MPRELISERGYARFVNQLNELPTFGRSPECWSLVECATVRLLFDEYFKIRERRKKKVVS